MIRPVDASIPISGRRAFGARRGTSIHQGVDLIAARGSPVVAVADGVVTHASRELASGFSGYGRIVVVRHGESGPWFLYAHLENVDVKPGERVQARDSLGSVGNTCFSKEDPTHRCSGAHLHFEVSPTRYPQASQAPRMDPVAYLSSGELGTPAPASTPATSTNARKPKTNAAAVAALALVGALWGFAMLITKGST